MTKNWHSISIKETIKILGGDLENGLSEKEVEIRKEKFGKNKLPEEKPLSRLRMFLEQFKSPLIYILVIAGVVTLIFKKYTDAIVIFGAVFLNTIVGFLQENKASQTLRSLKKLVKHSAQVLRSGNLKIIDSTGLVPGDIIVLNPGDKVPADAKVIESYNLSTNEMALTGEWLPAKKNPKTLLLKTPLADRDNMVYMGTIVEHGKGKATVTETGINTEIGKIVLMLRKTKEEKTPYQKKLANFSRIVARIIAFICFLIFILGLVRGKEFIEMFTIAVAMAVAAIPEGLPAAMTVILALGMKRILKEKGLIRRLASTETLGSTSVICSDKTATLTEGKMKVDEVIGNKFLILKAAVLTSESFIENPDESKKKWIIRGRPTDRALLEAGIEMRIDETPHQKFGEGEKRKIAEIPFNPINKFAVALYEENNKKILYVCGVPEKILAFSNLKEEKRKYWEEKLTELTKKGLRVVATAQKVIEPYHNSHPLEKLIFDLDFGGLVALKDPIRPGVKEAIEICHRAGIKPIIVTGDHKLTAKAVAEELGFKIEEKNILEGKDLDELSNKEFDKVLDKIKIYARVEPRHKMRIIEAWQKKEEIIAMTGDGINDAPALKKADIGIALGSGTDVAKEASDLILLTNSFNIIIKAIEEGRAILDNIRKVITYLLSDSFTEVILVGASLMAGLPLPLSPVQILWVNLIEDGPPSIALSFEPKEKDLMERGPANPKIPLLTKEMKTIIFVIGLVTDIILLGLFIFLWHKNHNIGYVRTMVFACLSIDSLFYVFSCKSLRKNIWQINLFSSIFLLIAVFCGFLTLFLALYLPFFQNLLGTVSLNRNDWLIILGLGIIEIILIEATKWYFIVKEKQSCINH